MTERAYADLIRLTNWLAARSPETAHRTTARFYTALPRLETRPFSCGLAHEDRYCPEELRHLLFEVRMGRMYRALSVVRDDLVKVVCVRAPGEKPVRPEDVEL
jgi:plasmid stabilization system protein ParE